MDAIYKQFGFVDFISRADIAPIGQLQPETPFEPIVMFNKTLPGESYPFFKLRSYSFFPCCFHF